MGYWLWAICALWLSHTGEAKADHFKLTASLICYPADEKYPGERVVASGIVQAETESPLLLLMVPYILPLLAVSAVSCQERMPS